MALARTVRTLLRPALPGPATLPGILPAILALLAALALAGTAGAQNIRSLGMGGVIAPGGAVGTNPAYASLPNELNSVPIPLGLINLLANLDKLDPTSPTVDLLFAADQAARLDAFLFNAATAPDEIIITISEGDAGPELSIDTVGGSSIRVLQGRAFAVGPDFDLPIRFPAGPVNVGIRPFLTTDLRWRPDADLAALFGSGTAGGSATFSAEAEAGLQVDVGYSLEIPIPAGTYPGSVYVGGTVSPFVSFARVQGSGTVDVTAAVDTVEYDIDGTALVSLVSDGNVGYGLKTDLGVVTVVRIPEGVVTAGFSLGELGFGVYTGNAYTITGSETVPPDLSAPTATSRTEFLGVPDMQLTAAIDLSLATIGVTELASLLVASDLGYVGGGFTGHLGTEAGFGIEDLGIIYARAGGGYDGGLLLGIGAGLDAFGVGFDLAVFGRGSVLTSDPSYGLSAGVRFGF